AMIRSRLRSTFVEAPNVTVSVVSVAAPIAEEEEEEIVTAEVYVLGEVASPGRYEYDSAEPITVIEALTLAGGLGPFAARARIQVRERVDGAEALRLFDYESFEEGRLASPADLTNLSDDAVIVVPERRLFE
ncbi:MAG: SLBB domain-containing protein, partial [Pseudomonadota bacterium]